MNSMLHREPGGRMSIAYGISGSLPEKQNSSDSHIGGKNQHKKRGRALKA
ncbi:MAG: hypothetical protein E7L01_14270 [Paenibacillus macerans]|uniref:Uncharacterized protein n=1 Tax=Paenibacillus macerans TaxID=44252 RepID=A0A090YB26_PAEMA|nr:hypothetical protein [Paenibacillus macerans]KFM95396.1 hypothetical protein DJ90_5494 [Paenibacillus macerans]MCY7558027.1 hypothetical protein [Paenibacillus macerans]MDU7474476.1 hypothetical protein [Paenibacillus macerans]MEC0135328.1 hypothetical protein [Paenibacillus macerans]MEC0154012.1 hypothetical protein [Paenibacillus macerans]